MPQVSVIVVTYNSEATIARCLGSIPDDCETIVVDNASSDATREIVRTRFPHVRLIENEANLGFGAANNIGLSEASGTYALLLNPDASAESGAIECLADFMDATRDAVACGGMLTYPHGRLQESACTELTLWKVFLEQSLLDKVFPSPYWVSSRHTGKPMRVAQVMGACLMMRSISGEFSRFDERFFLYMEDTELCKSLAEHGSIWYLPDCVFRHDLGTSSLTDRWRSVRFYNRGKELFFSIHHGKTASSACFVLNRFGAFLRLLIWGTPTLVTLGLVPQLRRRAGLWMRVLFAPLDPYP